MNDDKKTPAATVKRYKKKADKIEKPKTDVMIAIEKLTQDLKANRYVKGEMQFTDITNRDYFLKAYGHKLKYVKKWNKFLIWDDCRWKIDDEGIVEEWIVDFVHQMYRGMRFITDPTLKTAFEKHLIKSESFRRLQALEGICKMSKEIKVTEDKLDQDLDMFVAKNCMIDLATMMGRQSLPEDLSTKRSNFVFKKNATCPTWDKFLMQIFDNNKELIRFIQKAMGYSLSGHTGEQCLFILWGTGANGKSTFLNALQELFGDYSTTTGTETFMKKTSEQSNDIARLRGMRLVTTSEAEQGKPLSESLIKQITGGDALTARFLYGEYFSFNPTFKIFMATNHKPRIKGADNGIWRRIKLIPFNVTIPQEQRDKDLPNKLLAENSGIFNWLLRGYDMWKKEGLLEPEAIKNANEEYRFDMDS
ncbi:MAG: phage/plasmid primase, P4 family, partial [Spirochaetales bacterium]|nr:phage/plasmid primase, P4 family [Spirochaetales bacterium]